MVHLNLILRGGVPQVDGHIPEFGELTELLAEVHGQIDHGSNFRAADFQGHDIFTLSPTLQLEMSQGKRKLIDGRSQPFHQRRGGDLALFGGYQAHAQLSHIALDLGGDVLDFRLLHDPFFGLLD